MHATAEPVRLEMIEQREAPLPAVQPQGGKVVDLASALMQAASNPTVDMEKMERLWAMHEKLTARSSEELFNDRMCAAQREMRPVAHDADNPQTRSRYATYAALDRALRPIYTKHGFSISFNQGEGAPEGRIRVLAYVSCGGHTRTYHADMANDGKGAKGGDVMTKTHADGAAMSYGMRYLLKMIFNVAVGEDDDDGNSGGADSGPGPITEKILDGLLADLKLTKTDEAAALLWASGSKTLAATGRQEAYKEFKDAVVKHRTFLKAQATGVGK